MRMIRVRTEADDAEAGLEGLIGSVSSDRPISDYWNDEHERQRAAISKCRGEHQQLSPRRPKQPTAEPPQCRSQRQMHDRNNGHARPQHQALDRVKLVQLKDDALVKELEMEFGEAPNRRRVEDAESGRSCAGSGQQANCRLTACCDSQAFEE